MSPPAAPLGSGESTQFVVPVQIAGNGQYFSQSGTTTVSVQNLALQPFSPGLLFYDDDPEHVTQDGVLFRGTVSAAQPTRLYYYHDAAADPRRLVVTLTSNSQDPTSVQLVEASAGPNMDVMHVGQTLTKNFLLTKAQGEGVVGRSPAGRGLRTCRRADGRASTRQRQRRSARACGRPGCRNGPCGLLRDRSTLAARRTRPFRRRAPPHRRFSRSPAFGSDALAYSVGGADATLVIGDTEPTPESVDPAAPGHDYGDYGVEHVIDLTLTNPGSASAAAYLFIKPLAGPERGSFLIDGKLVDVGCVRLPVPYQITSFDLAPGQTYRTVVRTMTDGGSFYPAEIGLTATPPQPNAPSITAPDGCFPKPQASPAPQ